MGGLYLVNLARLVILARVGIARGPGALQDWHAHLGWVLFALFMAGFWAVVLRRHAGPDQPRPPTDPPGPAPATQAPEGAA